jgi:20S proteasome alpha/beta subunit
MDSLIAIKGKDFIVMAADTVNAYSVLRMKVTSNIMSRTTMIKFGISMEKNYSLSEDNTQMF